MIKMTNYNTPLPGVIAGRRGIFYLIEIKLDT